MQYKLKTSFGQYSNEVNLLPNTLSEFAFKGHPFKDVKLFYLDLVSSNVYPVNDFTVNMLYFKPLSTNKDILKYGSSCFKLGRDKNSEYLKLNISDIFESIRNFNTICFSKYTSNSQKKLRIEKMKYRGWTVTSESVTN